MIELFSKSYLFCESSNYLALIIPDLILGVLVIVYICMCVYIYIYIYIYIFSK